MTFRVGRLYFRFWRPPWKGWELSLHWEHKFDGPGYKTSVKTFDVKEDNSRWH
jgi:hypothetical protein